mmetsp:Transcript_15103/g.46071  ORF Transcript_15103/g.46071 Transcript_15103/m.46071 type:complete len:296 (-) Transcript_15103:716-1603(-)
MAVVYFAMWTLSEVLVLFFLAVALKYLLTPLIDFLSCRHPRSELYAERCYFRLGRKWAVLFALLISVVTLMAISFIVANSLSTFASRAGIYNARVEELIDYTFSEMHRLEIEFGLVNASDMSEARQMSHLAELEKEMAKHLDVSDTIVTLLGTASGVLEDVVYILLFLVFMLVEEQVEDEPNGRPRATSPAEQKIFDYIAGKTSLSCLVGIVHAAILTLSAPRLCTRVTPPHAALAPRLIFRDGPICQRSRPRDGPRACLRPAHLLAQLHPGHWGTAWCAPPTTLCGARSKVLDS